MAKLLFQNDDGPKASSIAPWFGGKRTLAPAIVQQFGEHRAYWEPFCGSMAVLLAKPPCTMETVCDLHGDLINLGRIIQHDTLGPKFYRKLRRVFVAEAQLEAAVAHLDRSPIPDDQVDLERAIAYFLQSWLMRSGVAGTNMQKRGAGRNIAIRYTPNGGSLSPRVKNVVDSIPAWRRRLRQVIIMRRDAFVILPKIEDQVGTVIYVDPPYLGNTRSGLKGSGAQSRYLHDFHHDSDSFWGDDHHRLAGELTRFKKARVVISYYDDPRLEVLYPGWQKLALKANKAIVQQGKRGQDGTTDAPEVLVINGPILKNTG